MSENNSIEQAVERVVSEVVESHIPQLRRELVARVLEALGPQLGAAPESSPTHLLKAITAIQAGSTQREILRTLLDHAVRYSGRTALFVIKAGAATGWQGRGFSNQEEIKDFPLDVTSGIAARAMQSRITVQGSTNEIDSRFIAHFTAAADGHVLLLPLLLKERVAALVYADAGAEGGGNLDAAAMELLVVAASAWLEVAASRKQVQKEGSADADTPQKTEKAYAAAAAQSSSSQASSFQGSSVQSSPFQGSSSHGSSTHDPFASHAPQHFAAAEAPAEEYAVAATAVAEPAAESVVEAGPAPSFEAPAPATESQETSAEDAETHRKAQRFARLLVDEIKLYNQAKVSEGRKNKDLYDRLKEDIDKSLATYQKRYGATAAAGANYFNVELVRSLAEDDTSVMGANFQR